MEAVREECNKNITVMAEEIKALETVSGVSKGPVTLKITSNFSMFCKNFKILAFNFKLFINTYFIWQCIAN